MSNILANKWLLDRRHLLRGLGATVALPLLDCMLPRRAVAAAATSKPRRSVFVYIPNGVNVLTWQITTAGRDYILSEPLRPLEKHRKNITPISGLHHPNGIGQGHVCADTWLTAAKIGIEGSYRNSVSCDQLMAEVTAPKTRFGSLELSVAAGVGQPNNASTLAWSRDGVPLPAENIPRIVFNRLFGEEPGGVDARRHLGQRRCVLDAVLDDAKSLRHQLGGEDRSKLDEYLNSVREVEVRAGRLEAWLTIPKPTVDPGTRDRLLRNVLPHQSFASDYYRTMYDLIVLALRTDMTRVVSFMSGSESIGLAIPEIAISQNRHELSHHNGDPEIMARLSRSDAFIAQQFAYFLDQLQSIRDGEETLLDRTMVLFGSGMSYGHSHGNANLPIILAGGQSLGIRHGQHIDYNLPKIKNYDLTDTGRHYSLCHSPCDGNARLTNLLLTMMQKMEVNMEGFVDSLGPISALVA